MGVWCVCVCVCVCVCARARLFCLCVVLLNTGRGLATGRSLVQGVLSIVEDQRKTTRTTLDTIRVRYKRNA
jgi:hypothetical protein